MWETVVLFALKRAGELRHEVVLPSGRKPDIDLLIPDGSDRIRLVGDITSVSDVGLQEQNPIEPFAKELVRLAKKHGHEPSHFRYEIRGDRVGKYRKSRMALRLPTVSKIPNFFREFVEPWIKDIQPGNPRRESLKVDNEIAGVSFHYNTGQHFFGGGHLSFDVAVSLTNNPIYRALKGKVDQLASVPGDALKLVILCDAGCAAMRSAGSPGMSFTAREIAQEFIRQNSSFDLVLLVTVKEDQPDWRGRRSLRGYCDIVSQRKSTGRPDFNGGLIRSAIDVAFSSFPVPVLNVESSARSALKKGYGYGMMGGMTMSDSKVKISAREVLELPAGRLNFTDFQKYHGWNGEEGGFLDKNIFMRMLESGRLVRSIQVVHGGHNDDDWLEFEFGSSDPAISPFKVNRTI